MRPLHCLLPGLHTPLHVPVPVHRYGHVVVVCQVPVPSQVCTAAPEQRTAPGVHVPVHAPLTHAYVHDWLSCQLPVASQVCAVLPTQRPAPGEHRPVHAAFWQANEHASVVCQAAVASHVCTFVPSQRVACGAQTPLHCPAPVHTNGHGVPAFQVPSAWQLRGVAPSQPTSPALQTPQTAWAVQ